MGNRTQFLHRNITSLSLPRNSMNEMNMTELNVYSFISADCFCIFMLAFCFEGLPGFVFVPSLYYTSDGVRCDSLAHCT